jgi:hypothetical protein
MDGVVVGVGVMVAVVVFDLVGVPGMLVADVFPISEHEKSRFARNTMKKNRVIFIILEPGYRVCSFMEALPRSLTFQYFLKKIQHHL